MTENIKVAADVLMEQLLVESLDLEARGVAHKSDGKVAFIEGALPFEIVSATINRRKNQWEQGTLTQIHRESSQRVNPRCPHFGLHAGACGGCKMQHLHMAAQVAVKQRVLEDSLWHLGKVRAETVLRPIEGPAWGYRYRARLSVRFVRKKGTVLIGFHERKSSYVADMQQCPVLPAPVSAMLVALRELMTSMDAAQTCPQIELACSETVTALVLRHLEPLSADDSGRLRAFAASHACVQWWLQPKGPQTAHLLDEGGVSLDYELPEFGVRLCFKPTDFTQVNPLINRALVSRAVRLLQVQRTERVIDWFCGLGNFTLPLASRAGSVLGVEGSAELVARSRQNYMTNKAAATVNQALCATEFVARNLFEMTAEGLLEIGVADKWLIDPPREGAFALIQSLVALRQHQLDPSAQPTTPAALHWQAPSRIVYVSCNPATLARDAGLLVHQAGYRSRAAGVVNMFPHTAHAESIAVFDLGP